MPRRAWLLITPEMTNELNEFIRRRQVPVATVNALPADAKFVGAKPARGGAVWQLVESESFEDLPPSDYPELPRPSRIVSEEQCDREKMVAARSSSDRLVI